MSIKGVVNKICFVLLIIFIYIYLFRLSQIGVVSYGSECPSHGVYARVTEVKHWIQFIAQGAEDTKCNTEIPLQPGINNQHIHIVPKERNFG